MLFFMFFIPFFIIYMTILWVTKSYFTVVFIFVASYLWYRALSVPRKWSQKRDTETSNENVLIFSKKPSWPKRE